MKGIRGRVMFQDVAPADVFTAWILFLHPPDVALQAIRQPAADLIRGGCFSLPLPLPSEAEGIDLCALLQVRSPRKDDMQSSSVSVEY
jgi:hypothetical protein